jgi:hypothetical protein
MKHLVIGLGEVGNALRTILECSGYDLDKGVVPTEREFDFIHICFPYSDNFEKEVRGYKEMFKPRVVVIHSTVPVGTSKALGAVNSPVRGKHPDLVQSLKTFVKFVGGEEAGAFEVCFELSKYGIECEMIQSSDDTEALKLWDTTQYGAMIMLEKEIHAWCVKHNLNFDVVYSEGNRTYNEGYAAMGMPQVIRPNLTHQDGPIGGHCVVQNCKLLDSETPKKILDMHSNGGVDNEKVV